MPYRRVQQHSDRGSIRDLQNKQEDDFPPTDYELRVKDLYEHAMVTRNQALVDSLGLIPLNGAANDPVSIFRHREYVKSLSDKLAAQIQETAKEIEGCLAVDETTLHRELQNSRYKQANSLAAISDTDELLKTASTSPRRSFRRVI
jgi:hypothetical protein